VGNNNLGATMRFLKLTIAICLALSFSRAHAEGEATDTRVPVPTGKYITGGVLASTIGFGIGHGVQGRYSDKGWIFTATEVGGVALLAIGSASCKDEYDVYGIKTTKCSNAAIGLVGLGVLIGFHVWEIVDAWSGARGVDDGPKAFILPNPEAPGLGLAWSF